MKTIVALFLACFATAMFGQAPPVLRTLLTTNSAANAVNANQFDVSGGKLSVKDAPLFTNVNAFGNLELRDYTDGVLKVLDGTVGLVTIGSGLSFDGTTLSSSGGSGIATLNGIGTNTTLYSNINVGASGMISNNPVTGALDLIPTNGAAFTGFRLHLSGGGNGIGTITPTLQAALDVPSGNVYIGNAYPTNILVPINASNLTAQTFAFFNGDFAGYAQLNLKNNNTTAGSSGDLVVTAGHGNETNHYVDMGINGPNGGSQPFTNGGYAYFYSQPSNNQPHLLNIGALGSNSAIAFFAGAPLVGASGSVTNPVERMRLSTNGNLGIGTNAPNRPLDIAGTMVAGAGSVAQPTYAFNNTTNTGWYSPSTEQIASTHAGVAGFNVVGSGLIRLRNTMLLAWASGDPTSQNADTAIQRHVPGALTLTNLGTSAGAVLGGTIAASNHVRASAGLSATNLATNSIRGNTLTNNNDAVVYNAFGQAANLLPGTNRFELVYGSQTIFDTGNQTWSNTTYRITAIIIRTGNTNQAYNVEFKVGGMPVGSPFALTNSAGTTFQTNGIDTFLILRTTSFANGALTNFANRLKLEPYTQ